MAPLHDLPITIRPHPNGIKPSGNMVLSDRTGNGARIDYIRLLPDEIIHTLFQSLAVEEVVALSHTCKYLYAFSLSEELWKDLYTNMDLDSPWRGSWRNSALSIDSDSSPCIRVSDVYSDLLYRPYMNTLIDLHHYLPSRRSNMIPRFEYMSREKFEAGHVHHPFILTREIERWPALGKWTTEQLTQEYGDTRFRAECVDWTLKRYVAYMRNNQDESPLYLFDSHFAEKTLDAGTGRSLDSDYTVPDCFDEDAFKILGQARPDHKWLIVGPARSGSTFHKDPNGTSAWNAVITGSKLWIMLPPDSPPPGVYVSADESEVTAPLSIAEWLLTYHQAARNCKGFMEGVCGPGEILYVPSGWWHLVVNLEECIAVTQNFVPRAYIGRVMRFLREKRNQISGFDKSLEVYELFARLVQASYPNEYRAVMKAQTSTWDGLRTAAQVGQGSEVPTFSFDFADDSDDDSDP